MLQTTQLQMLKRPGNNVRIVACMAAYLLIRSCMAAYLLNQVHTFGTLHTVGIVDDVGDVVSLTDLPHLR